MLDLIIAGLLAVIFLLVAFSQANKYYVDISC